MNWLNKLPGSRREAPGLERRFWYQLPRALLAGTVLGILPLAYELLAHLFAADATHSQSWRVLALASYSLAGLGLSTWLSVVGVAIGCATVMLMKGPAYAADAYEVPYRERPLTTVRRGDHARRRMPASLAADRR
jgi:hypothetical protein